jgi:hypothetical protein
MWEVARQEYKQLQKVFTQDKRLKLSHCRDCEDRIKLNTEWKDGKLLCHICGEYKEPSEFTYAGANKYTLRQNKECRCNSCKLEQRKAAIATYDNDVKLEKVLQARWLAAKSRAIDKSIPFTITKEDLLTVWKAQNGKCAISGLDMTYELGEGRIYTNVSIDQIMPSKGYTIDNIQLVCMAVNQLKSDLDMDTILILCSAIVDNAAKWKH